MLDDMDSSQKFNILVWAVIIFVGYILLTVAMMWFEGRAI